MGSQCSRIQVRPFGHHRSPTCAIRTSQPLPKIKFTCRTPGRAGSSSCLAYRHASPSGASRGLWRRQTGGHVAGKWCPQGAAHTATEGAATRSQHDSGRNRPAVSLVKARSSNISELQKPGRSMMSGRFALSVRRRRTFRTPINSCTQGRSCARSPSADRVCGSCLYTACRPLEVIPRRESPKLVDCVLDYSQA